MLCICLVCSEEHAIWLVNRQEASTVDHWYRTFCVHFVLRNNSSLLPTKVVTLRIILVYTLKLVEDVKPPAFLSPANLISEECLYCTVGEAMVRFSCIIKHCGRWN